MKIIRAAHLGMCFGVRDAIRLALESNASRPVTILGDLVHNEVVLEQLKRTGVRVAQEIAPNHSGDVLISAHGASERTINSLQKRGLNVIEATCPLVHAAHRAVRGLAAEGYHPVIIGKRDHVEVRGLTGDLSEFDIILEETDIAKLRERSRFGVAAQTTQPLERVRHLVDLLRVQFPKSEVRWVDTVCQPTKQRQAAAIELASAVDLVIVIGGRESNNTRELVQTCRRYCARVYQVVRPEDLETAWFEETESVGITAGTSTPDSVIDSVENRVRQLSMTPAVNSLS